METVRKTMMMGIVLLPSLVFAATDCRVTEYPDHYEAACTGTEKSGSVQAQTTVKTPIPVQAKIPDVARTLTDAGIPGVEQSSDTIQARALSNMPMTVKSPVKAQTALSSQTDVDNATAATMRRSARTTAMEAAIVARRRLILDRQSNKLNDANQGISE